ncbi:elongation factor Ts [Bremerella volcania]|uniref:Elongation factor Ts n=1 Tax=Bremerella volcania TaxID=2527984 RepID=A0A518C3S9_9BACT|nr:hypothetical protein [Bremerella volcania]QDU73881.1 elongation factor Ts [Bremerella volcania]
MVDAKQLKELRRLTNAGLSDCKQALIDADGNLFKAATAMLTEEKALELQQSVRVRRMAGQSIKDPVTKEEEDFVDALVDHFIAQRTRPLNVVFMLELTAYFLSDETFREMVADDPTRAMQEVWNLIDRDDDNQSPPVAQTIDSGSRLATVVTMPKPQSEWECDFVVLQHPYRRFLFWTKRKVFVVYKRTKLDDHGIVNVHEMNVSNDGVFASREWVLADADLSPQQLALIGDTSATRVRV